MDTDRIEKLIQFALLVAGQKDEFYERELSRIHLIKYVYLADLAYAIKHGGVTWSQAPWQFYHFGPWAAEVNDWIPLAAHGLGAQERSLTSKYGDDTIRWSVANDNETEHLLEELERELPIEVSLSIRSNVRNFGNDTEGLLHHTYMTEPMLRATPGSQLLFLAEPREEFVPPAQSLEPSAKQKKRSQAALEAARARFAERFAAHQKAKATEEYAPPPRYDDEFFEGVKWLDSLAGDVPPSGEVLARFDSSVWESDTRRARR